MSERPDEGTWQPSGELRSTTSKEEENSSAQELFNSIRSAIVAAIESALLSYENIDPNTGRLVSLSLREDASIERSESRIHHNSETTLLQISVMPTHVQDCHQEWFIKELFSMIQAGFLLQNEWNIIVPRTGTTFEGFRPPYALSHKEPDSCILTIDQGMPTIVFESGWTESHPRLRSDTNLWTIGGASTVQLVFTIQWSKLSGGRVEGVMEVYNRSACGHCKPARPSGAV
ncbi:hypothetical protein VTN00DRAFT_4726 [Thermoascus crustaceus]|uniref:uncharacterized protein n=1 Tax=Thermoascus crustaceus TaxID=5088 RepID=UPI0037443E42